MSALEWDNVIRHKADEGGFLVAWFDKLQHEAAVNLYITRSLGGFKFHYRKSVITPAVLDQFAPVDTLEEAKRYVETIWRTA